MTETTNNGECSEYNEVWHSGRGSYYYNGYLYSGSAPTSHTPSGSAPSTPTSYGSITVAGIQLNYNGNPNFTNYAYINPEAILDEKYPKPPEPVTPDPAENISGVDAPLTNESVWWAGTKAVGWSLMTGVANLAKGGYNMGKEMAFTVVDIGAVSVDTVATLAGRPIGWKEWSSQGKNYKNSTGLDIATNAARSGLAGGTLGVSEIAIGLINYAQDGDADAFQQHIGGVAAGNLVAAGAIKLGQTLKGTKYPPNKGFSGEPILTNLERGTIIDRYGGEGGRFVAPKGTPVSERSLPHGAESGPLSTYEVIVSIDYVWEGKTAPWFGQPGGGTQYLLPKDIRNLLFDKALKELK